MTSCGVVRLAPLVAIDLVIRNARGDILLGLRNNEPAEGMLFRARRHDPEERAAARRFGRILKGETNFTAAIEDGRLLGAYEHFYENNRFGEPGYGTHYVVLGYELKIDDTAALKSDDQHSELRWWTEADLLASPDVHHNTKAYFHRP